MRLVSAASIAAVAVAAAIAGPAATASAHPVVAPAHTTAASGLSAVVPAITWQHKEEVTLRDRCGGANGWVQWSGSDIQTYGEVWENASSCGGPGYHYLELYYIRAGIQFNWSSDEAGQIAEPGKTVGFNSGVLTGDANVSNIELFLCSTEADQCNAVQTF